MTDLKTVHQTLPAALKASTAALGLQLTPVNDLASPRRSSTWLAQAIEEDIVPRLVSARRASPARSGASGGNAGKKPAVENADVLAMAHASLARDGACEALVQQMCARGVGLEDIYLEVLAGAADQLGAWWCDDARDFTEVTLGVWRLRQVMHGLAPEFCDNVSPLAVGMRAIIVPVPGGQHTFGSQMVAEFFRRAGWTVHGEPGMSAGDIVRLVRRQASDLIAISASCEEQLPAVAAVVRLARRSAPNPLVQIMVGGHIFKERPELVQRVGADFTAPDAKQAELRARRRVRERRRLS